MHMLDTITSKVDNRHMNIHRYLIYKFNSRFFTLVTTKFHSPICKTHTDTKQVNLKNDMTLDVIMSFLLCAR